MSMNHDQTWLNGILSWDKKQTSYSFLFPEFSQVKSHSLLSSFRCLVCCRIELLWMWNGCSFTGSDSIRDRRYYQDFPGGNITTTAITQITHYLVSTDQWLINDYDYTSLHFPIWLTNLFLSFIYPSFWQQPSHEFKVCRRGHIRKE